MDKVSPAKIWRLQKYRYRLKGSYCAKCRKRYYPFKFFCPSCHSDQNIKDIELSPFGKVISWSQIYFAPAGFEKYAPYVIALIKLSDGPVILSQLCDCDFSKVKFGLKVEAVFRKLALPDDQSVIKYGIKFRPTNW